MSQVPLPTEAVTLLHCPFCGSKPQHGLGPKQHCQLHGDPFQRYRVWCASCGGYGYDGANVRLEHVNQEQAFKAWNGRAA